MTRYTRQTILPEVGNDGQAALAAATIVIVGVGGLGCPAAQYLVAAGVGTIILIDGDTVALSNLHRQTLFREDEVGQYKAHAAARSLSRLNSEYIITPLTEHLTPNNATELIEQATLVLDCADSFATSYTLSDCCKASGTPMISASALGLEGYVGGFCGSAPSLRAVFPDLPDRSATCATAGVLGPVVGIIGAAQAQMALSVLLGLQPSPLGQLVTFSMHNLRSGGFRFDTAPEPQEGFWEFIATEDIQTSDFVVELRDTIEAPLPVVPSALRMSVDGISLSRPTPQDGQRAVLTCRSGLRSWQAAKQLRSYWDGPISLIAMGDTAQSETSTLNPMSDTQSIPASLETPSGERHDNC